MPISLGTAFSSLATLSELFHKILEFILCIFLTIFAITNMLELSESDLFLGKAKLTPEHLST